MAPFHRGNDITAVLARWLPEGMHPSPDLQQLAETAVDALAATGALRHVPFADADETTTLIVDRIKARLAASLAADASTVVLTDEVGRLVARVTDSEHDAHHAFAAYTTLGDLIDTQIGKALDVPRYPADRDAGDQRCTGEHTPESLVETLCAAYTADHTELVDLRSRRPVLQRFHYGDPVLYGSWTDPRYVQMGAWDWDTRTWTYLATRPGGASIETTEDLLRPWLDDTGHCWCTRAGYCFRQSAHDPGVPGCVVPPGIEGDAALSYDTWTSYRDTVAATP